MTVTVSTKFGTQVSSCCQRWTAVDVLVCRVAEMMSVVVSTTDQFLSSAAVNTTSASLSDFDNHTGNRTDEVLGGSAYAGWQVALIAVACGILVVGTIVGNVLVVTAIVVVRRLRTPSNLLIVSLATSDLLVALLVMPFAAMYEVGLYKSHRHYTGLHSTHTVVFFFIVAR